MLDEADECSTWFREICSHLETTPETAAPCCLRHPAQGLVTLGDALQKDALRIARAEKHPVTPISSIALSASRQQDRARRGHLLRFWTRPVRWFSATPQCGAHMEAQLTERAFPVALSASSQSERNHALQALRDGRARFASPRMWRARGIDLPSLTW